MAKLINPIFLLLVIMTGIMSCTENDTTLNVKTYNKLDEIVANRKKQLVHYMESIHQKAASIKEDEVMRNFFTLKKEYYHLTKTSKLPERFNRKIQKLNHDIQHHYILNYLQFYDILFIDSNGHIFYTIKKQKDYLKNVFKGKLSHTALSAQLEKRTSESFVDFQFYDISGEPSAFFIEPIVNNEDISGWIVLQCAINKINSLFSFHKNLGATGEVFLVNENHYMLTDSRFKASSSILKQRLATENMSRKFAERKGHKSVIDYRDKRVYSSFEVFEFLKSQWLIIAKIDEDEVITNHYMQHQNEFPDLFKPAGRKYSHEVTFFKPPDSLIMNVDMDEFRRVDSTAVLYTPGVSTCTVVSVSYPGHFTYIAHISPFDKIYGESKTDLLGQILKRLTYFEILQSEKQNLEFVIVTTHNKTTKNIVDILVNSGYFLSQIKLMYEPRAKYANIYYDHDLNKCIVIWRNKVGKQEFIQQTGDMVPSIGEIMKMKL